MTIQIAKQFVLLGLNCHPVIIRSPEDSELIPSYLLANLKTKDESAEEFMFEWLSGAVYQTNNLIYYINTDVRF